MIKIFKWIAIIFGCLIAIPLIIGMFSDCSSEQDDLQEKQLITLTNAGEFPHIIISGTQEQYDGWKGLYKVSFNVSNTSDTTYQIMQFDADFYYEGERLSPGMGGNYLEANGNAPVSINTISPDGKPDEIKITINKEMTEAFKK